MAKISTAAPSVAAKQSNLRLVISYRLITSDHRVFCIGCRGIYFHNILEYTAYSDGSARLTIGTGIPALRIIGPESDFDYIATPEQFRARGLESAKKSVVTKWDLSQQYTPFGFVVDVLGGSDLDNIEIMLGHDN